MKYTNSIEIALPREKVAQLLADPAHIPSWVRGVVLHEPVNGTHGQLGTTSRVVMQSGQRKIQLTETITRRDPADLHGRGGCPRSEELISATATRISDSDRPPRGAPGHCRPHRPPRGIDTSSQARKTSVEC